MRTRLVLVLSALLLVTALFLWLRPQPFPVEVAVADRGPVRVELRGEGETRARTGTHDEVSAPFPGAWTPAPLEVGDRVRRGQRLGALAPVPLDGTARAAALERVQSADANAREAQDALARGERLFEAGALSTEGLQHLRTAQVAAASELASARAALGRGEEVTVRSPLSGWVLRAPEPHARTVNAGALLFEVGDPAALDVIVDLRTEDAVAVRPGAAAELRPSPDAPPIGATVERVEPSAFTEVSPLGVEEQRVNLVLRFDRPPTGLGVGWRVEATIIAHEADGVVRVPVAALVRVGPEWAVWVVTDGRARRRPVVLGAMGTDLVEVRSGLEAGTEVILRPEDTVREGRRVAAVATD